ncbi:MAG: hypothetical protein ACP5I1_01180, partial [Candidatus Hinthialibacter sp.]
MLLSADWVVTADADLTLQATGSEIQLVEDGSIIQHESFDNLGGSGADYAVRIDGNDYDVNLTIDASVLAVKKIQENGGIVFDGGAGQDELIAPDVENHWIITGSNEGSLQSEDVLIRFSGVENLTGGGDQDTFAFEESGSLTGVIDGGAGNDTLTGGAGDDILKGGAGDDTYKFADDWGRDEIIDPEGESLLDFSAFTGELTLRSPNATTPEVEGVANSKTNTIDYSGDATFTTDIEILAQGENNLKQGFSELADLGDDLDERGKLDIPISPYATSGMTLGEFLDIGGILKEHIYQNVDDYLASDADHTLDELVDVLGQASGDYGDLVVVLDPVASLSNDGVLTLDLNLSATRTVHGIDLRLGPDVEEYLFADALTGEMSAAFHWDFIVEINASGEFYGDFSNDIEVAAVINLVNSNGTVNHEFTARRGFLGLDVKNKGMELDEPYKILNAELSIDLSELDANNDGSTSLTELQDGNPDDLGQSGSAMVGFDLEIQAQDGVSGVNSAALQYHDDLFDDADPVEPVTTGFDDSIPDFDYTNGGIVLNSFRQFGDFLDIFGTKALNIPITLTDGLTLNDLFDLKAMFQEQVIDLLELQLPSENTFLSSLNGGAGVRTTLPGLPDLEVTLSNGTAFTVDLSSATTLGDVIAAIESASGLGAGAFDVSIDSEGGGLKLVDKLNGGHEFNIKPLNYSPALDDLGLKGPGEEDPDNSNHWIITGKVGYPGPNFLTIQGMLQNLGVNWDGSPAQYDAGTHGLSFDLSVDLIGSDPDDAVLALFDMGPLTELVTSSGVDLTSTGELILPMELLLTPLGFDAPLSEGSDLDLLNRNNGVRTNEFETLNSTLLSASNPPTSENPELKGEYGLFGEEDSLVGMEVEITSGVAEGETRMILANTSDATDHQFDVLTLDREWEDGKIPEAGDSFVIDGADIEVHLRDGSVFTVDLDQDSPETLGDLVSLFRSESGVNFDIRIDDDHLILIDKSTPPPEITGTVTTPVSLGDGNSDDDDRLIDSNAAFGEDDGLAGYTIQITDGTGAGQERKIIANTGGELTVDYPWEMDLDVTSQYAIFWAFEVLAIGDSPSRNDLGLVSVGSEQTLSADTPVSDVNGWRGLETNGTSSADIEITLRNGASFTVDLDVLSEDDLMSDLMQEIQNQSGLEKTVFEARIDEGSGDLMLVDYTTGSSDFSVRVIHDSSAALSLGLAGVLAVEKDVDLDDSNEYVIEFQPGPAVILEGNVLHGDTASAHIGIRLDGDSETASNHFVFDVEASDEGGVNAEGLWGVLGVTVTGGEIQSSETNVVIELADPGTDYATDNLATFRELSEGLADVENIIDTQTAGGSLELNLPLTPSSEFAGISGGSAVLNVQWPDITNLDDLSLKFTSDNTVQSLLEAVHDLTIDEVVSALENAADYLVLLQNEAQLGGQDNWLDYRIPGLDQSVGQLLQFGNRFKDEIAQLHDGLDDPQILQDLEGKLNELTDLSASLSFDAADSELKIDLTYSPSATVQVPFKLDLVGLGVDLEAKKLDTIGVIRDWINSDPVTAVITSEINLDVVLDLKAATGDPLGERNETPSLGGAATTFDITVDESDMNFESSLGSLAVQVVGGVFKLDADGSGVGTAPAEFTVTLSGSHPIADSSGVSAAANAAETTFNGLLYIDLPMEFPEEIPPDQDPLV